MADRYFVGANGTNAVPTAWNTTASWSTVQNGASGASVPVGGDAIFLNKNKTAQAFLNVATTAMPNTAGTSLTVSAGGGANNQYMIQGANASTAGLTWTLTVPITIQVDSGCVLTYRNAISGGGTITKTGVGLFGNDGLTTTWGTSPIDLQGGVLFANNAATNKLGTGKITMSAGTAVYNTSPSTLCSLGNAFDIRGDVFLNVDGDFGADTTAKGVLQITGAVDLDSVTRTVNVGAAAASNAAPVHLTGAVTGTAGFALEGQSYVWLAANNPGLSGTITVNTVNSVITGLGTADPPTGTGNVIPNVTAVVLSVGGANYQIRSNAGYTLPQTISGAGYVAARVTAAGGLTVPAANVVGHTGYMAPYAVGGTSYLNLETFNGINFLLQGASPRGIVTYTGTAPLTTVLNTQLSAISSPTGTAIGTFRQNSSAGNTVTFSTQVSGTGSAFVGTFELGGSNADDNTVSGNIVNGTATTLNFLKSDAGKWILSGTNTFNGTLTASGGSLVLSGSNTTAGASALTGGTLTIANTNALQNSTLTWQTVGTTLTFDGALTAATFGGLAGTAAAGLTLTVPAALTLSVGNNNSGNTFANPVSGTGTLTKIGTGDQTYSGSFAGFTGTTTLTNGRAVYTASLFGVATFNHATVGVRTSKLVVLNPTVTGGYSFPAGFQFTGDGSIFLTPSNVTTFSTGFTLPAGALTGLTGTAAAGAATGSVAGFISQTGDGFRTNIFNINEFPGGVSGGVLGYEFVATTANAMTQSIFYVSSGATHNYPARMDIINYSGTATNTSTVNLYANQATGPLVLSGGVERYAQNATQTVNFTLRGTSTADNEISGPIDQNSGVLAVTKTDAGKWILSGAGTHTAATTISGGQLVIKNTNAVQSSTVTWQTAGTTLTLDPSVTAFTFGGLAGTAASLTLTVNAGQNLSIGNNNSANIFNNAVSGAGTITKIGTAQHVFQGSMAGFTGTVTETTGLLTFSSSVFGAFTISMPSTGSITPLNVVELAPIVTNGYSFPAGFQLSGNGMMALWATNTTSLTTGFTLPVGALTGLTGTGAGSSAGPTSGLYLQTSSTIVNDVVNINEFPGGGSPGVLSFLFIPTTTAAQVQSLFYVSAAASHTYVTRLDLINLTGNTAIASQTVNLYANQATGPLILSGGVNRYAPTSTQTVIFTLRGTSVANNEISGAIAESSPGVYITALTKNDAGKWVLSGTNTYTGASTLTLGTLLLTNGAALGSSSSSALTTLSAGTLQVQGGITVNKTSSVWNLNGATVENVSGNNTITAASWSIGAATTILTTADTLTVTNALAGALGNSLNKTGTGKLALTNTSSGFLGPVTVSAGTLEVTKLANAASVSSLGQQASAQATITAGSNATLRHVGTTTDSFDRSVTSNAAAGADLTLDSSGTGSGAMVLSTGVAPNGNLTFSVVGSHNLILTGTNTVTNIIDRTLTSMGVVKNGTNTWSLTGAITTPLAFACNGGTLNLGSLNRTLGNGLTVTAGTLTITNGNTVAANTTMSGGTITAVLTGANTMTVTAGATQVAPAVLQPDATTTGSNTFTGAVAIDGCVDLITPSAVIVPTAGNGRVLGTSNTVTVSGTGIIRTKTTSTSNQRGQARYNNLTLQSGSVMKIGFAA